MPGKRIPKGPRDNRTYEEGTYDAIVHKIEYGGYGPGGDYYFRIILWLVQKEAFIVTNIYVRGDKRSALKRIWYFCQACGVSDKGFYKRLNEFKGKHIRVTLTTVPPDRSGAQNPFSDGDRFLKAAKPLTAEQRAVYEQATSPKPKSVPTKEKNAEGQTRCIDIFAV